ncbi:transposase [Oculatella sp. FACHB-28]|uniref:transposase n=1 Tax=Oculatella sp. FACHB-28 TaxID=2692845 RepID=UPI001685F37F|nr:transposase [Oculatella sp. FACHB-28]MBD2057638.1 transposase [Oculatella sp. FACHB-28]
MTLAYVSELTLEQYELFEGLITRKSNCGRPRSVNLMLVLQAILYVLVSGWVVSQKLIKGKRSVSFAFP